MNVIEVKGLTKDYGRGRGIFGVSFSVGRGETCLLYTSRWV